MVLVAEDDVNQRVQQKDINSMRQRKGRPQYRQQFKTFNSQESCIDIFSKVESMFLQKYFRYNLTDYFQDCLANCEEQFPKKKIKNRVLKQLLSQSYIARIDLETAELEKRMNQFYASRSNVVASGQFTHGFKHLFSSSPKGVKQNELVIVQVKIKADIEKIQNTPANFFREINQYLTENPHLQHEEPEILEKMRQYAKDSINFFMVYYGDINFDVANKQNYRQSKVTFLGKELQVRTVVFYISRLCMIDTFKKVNKIQNLQHINDILIQLYEFKREKVRNKKKNKEKKIESVVEKRETENIENWAKIGGMIVLGSITIAIVFKYLLWKSRSGPPLPNPPKPQ